MDSSQLYVIAKPRPGSDVDAEYLPERGRTLADAPRCTLCGGYTDGLAWMPPYRVEVTVYQGAPPDVLFGVTPYLLVSPRFLRAFREAGLNGFTKVYPVAVTRVRPKRWVQALPRYVLIKPADDTAAVDQVRSGFDGYVGEPYAVCRECRLGPRVYPKRWRCIAIQDGTWSGTDLFRPIGYNVLLGSARLESVCRNVGISGIRFVPAGSYSGDFYPWEKARTLSGE